ncbi:MAG TPA: condensation domain-containing protein, partial [Thermoanaerobaculia bacterium]
FAQERLWFLDRLQPASAQYNLPAALKLLGALSVPALARAFAAIVERHAPLRATFRESVRGPRQTIAPRLEVGLPVVDLTALPAARRERETVRLQAEEARRPFDLACGPLLRTALLALEAESWLLLVTLHHIVSDGWSIGVLVRECAALYAAARRGEASPLPGLAADYSDFVVWQRRELRDEKLAGLLDYWRRQVADAPPLLPLPTDRPRPAEPSHRGARLPVRLPADLSAAVHRAAQKEGATPFMALLAAFQLLLARTAGEPSVPVGTPVANRSRSELEGLIGLFVNTLVLVGRPDERASFRDLVRDARTAVLEAHTHQELPFERLVQELRVERQFGHGPLFQVMLVLQNAPADELRLPDLEIQPKEVFSGAAKLDLALDLTEARGELVGFLEYATDLFDRPTIQRFAGHLEILLRGLVTSPDRLLATVEHLSEAERHQLLLAWNATDGSSGAARCLHELIAAQAERSPAGGAVEIEGTELAYGELSIANTRLHVLDREGRPVPIGVAGELHIGGVGRSHLRRPELTAERFVPDPFARISGEIGGRLYRTGDLARHLAGGEIELLGRLDQQVRVRGGPIE